MSDQNFDTDSITFQEAKDALDDPVKGSLRVLKILGKQRDIYSALLAEGAIRLEAKNDLEQVAAEAAIEAFVAELTEDGEKPPKISVVRPRAAFK
ncbi:MAG: hypothetical protein LBE31_01155 [Deltaproteobacteria bacterium]|jgi:hypothetical protein|nr:hypothetical protein [Deltaproteobacteria bacterium]